MTVSEFLALPNSEQQIIMQTTNGNFNKGLDAGSKIAADSQNASGMTVATTIKVKDLTESNPLEFRVKNDTTATLNGVFYDALGIVAAKTDSTTAFDGSAGPLTFQYYHDRSTGTPLIFDAIQVEIVEGDASTGTIYQKIKLYEVDYPAVPSPDKLFSTPQEIKLQSNVVDVSTASVTPTKTAVGTSLIEFITKRAYYVTIPPNTTLLITLQPKLEGNAFSAAR